MLSFFFFNDTATTEIYTLSLHDALPISSGRGVRPLDLIPSALRPRRLTRPQWITVGTLAATVVLAIAALLDRKSTRLNSSHLVISYAVFCLKKKTKTS